MKINRGTREEFTDTISAKKGGKMLKMIKENDNKRIFNEILHGKINVRRPIKKIYVLTEENTMGHCPNI